MGGNEISKWMEREEFQFFALQSSVWSFNSKPVLFFKNLNVFKANSKIKRIYVIYAQVKSAKSYWSLLIWVIFAKG